MLEYRDRNDYHSSKSIGVKGYKRKRLQRWDGNSPITIIIFYDLSSSRIKPRKVFTHACARLHAFSRRRRRHRGGAERNMPRWSRKSESRLEREGEGEGEREREREIQKVLDGAQA